MTISLKDVGSGYKRSAINENFQSIEDEINNNLLSKNGGNALEADLDANSQKVINLANGLNGSDAVNLNQLQGAISAASSGLIASQIERQTGSSAVSRVFTFTGITYTVAANNLSVYRNGQRLDVGVDFTETSSSSITLTFDPNDADKFVFITNEATTTEVGNTAAITHTQSGADYNLATYLQNRYVVNVLDFVGVDPTGATDSTAGIKAADTYAASVGKDIEFPTGNYSFANVTFSDGVSLVGAGKETTTFTKNANGFLFDLGRRADCTGIGFAGSSVTYTGTGIQISRGDNSATRSLQGHQRISRCKFDDFDSYDIEYTTANKGWMSRVAECDFGALVNADAHIKWPDEPANGGNRSVIDCYSSGPLVNVGGCDNGTIALNTIGGSGASEDCIIFPSGTVNPAKKIILNDNRIALAAGTMLVRGQTHSIDNNIFAGSVEFDTGTTQCNFSSTNTLTGTLTDNSVHPTPNNIYDHVVGYTPVWTADTVNPSFGNADVRAKYRRNGDMVEVDVHITFGSTSTFGTGTWHFDNPLPIQTGHTKKYTGSAWVKANGGMCFVEAATNTVTLYRTDTVGTIGSTFPAGWASGDQLIFQYRYEL